MPRLGLLLLLLLAAAACRAQTTVHHCVAADGTPVFTDQPCNSLQARAVGARSGPAGPHHACPATREALKRRIAQAFTARDANALAGLMLWSGYSDRTAVRDVNHIRRLMQRPLLGVEDVANSGFDDGFDTPATPVTTLSSPSPVEPQADIQVELGGIDPAGNGPPRYAVVVRAGCLWLLP